MADDTLSLEEANAKFGAGDYAGALAAFTAIRDADPPVVDLSAAGSAPLHSNIGAALERLDRLDEAIAAYDAAVAVDPTYQAALHNRGVALKRADRAEDAIASFDAAIALDETFAASHRGKVEALTALERHDDAIAAATRAIELDTADAQRLVDRGFAHIKAEHWTAAVADYAAAKETFEAGAGAMDDAATNCYGVALSQAATAAAAANEFSDACDLYKRAAELTASGPRWFNAGVCASKAERADDAIEAYGKAAELDPDNVNAHYARGLLALQKEDLETAEASLAATVKLDADNAEAHYNLGFVYLKSQRAKEAKEQFAEALRADPEFAAAKTALATLEGPGGEGAGTGAGESTDASAGASEGGDGAAAVAPAEDAEEPAAAKAVEPAAAEDAAPAASPTAAAPTAAAVGPPAPPALPIRPPTEHVHPAAGSGAATSDEPAGVEPSDDGPLPTFPLDKLKAPGPYPDGVVPSKRELHLSDSDFEALFGCDKAAFGALPKWKQTAQKKKHSLF